MFFSSILSLLFVVFVAVVNSKAEIRIIGGADAPAGQFPFAAAIYIENANSRYFCGGALINNEWLITSGHCAHNATHFAIQLGSNTLTSEDSNRVNVTTSEYVLHPEFNPNSIYNDIALVRLRAHVRYNDYIQPINLPNVQLINESSVTAIGWGQTSDFDSSLSEHLQYVKANILSNAECRLIYGNQITDEMACVEGNYNEGTCTGDTGGPLIEYLSRHYWIVGVASFISGNGCESTDPSGYTRVYPFVQWIKNVTNNKFN